MLFVDSMSYHYLTVIILQQGSLDFFGPLLCDYAVLIFFLWAIAHLSFKLGIITEAQFLFELLVWK